MIAQPDLFTNTPPPEAPPYQRHSITSYSAAKEIAGSGGTLRRKVFDHLWFRGSRGATDDEIQVNLHMNPSTQRPRRIELVDKGLVMDSGRTRLTRGRRSAVVWVCAV